MSFDAVSYKLGKLKGGGGGNPNSVLTISGTLVNPWGDVDPTTILTVEDVGAVLFVNGSAIGSQNVTLSLSVEGASFGKIRFNSCMYDSGWNAVEVVYNSETGELSQAVTLIQGVTTDMSQYAAMIPTTLMIINHPLPANA